VVKARDNRDDSVVAVKIVQIETDNTKELIREISILSKCRSKYIVNYCGSYRHKDEIWITMEYCTAGSVGDVIKITKKRLKESEIAVIAKHALSGLRYLHKNNIIHRDIKAGNILLNEQGQCKLADFGVSAQLAQTISRRNTVIGSPYWMAPEVLKQNNYDQKADIWSMGIAVIEMAEGRPPLSDLHPLRALLQIPSNPPPTLSDNQWTQNMHSFLALCLEKNPDLRSTASMLLKHPFIKNAGKKTVIQELVISVMPKIEKYREEKRKKDMIELQEKERKKKKKKKKSSKKSSRKKSATKTVYNAVEIPDDETMNTMIINNGVQSEQHIISQAVRNEEEENNEDEDDGQYLTMIRREKPLRNEEEEKRLNIDPRDPMNIISPLFSERSTIYKEFELDDYVQDDPTKEQLMEIRKSLWTAYWKDKQILDDYYIDCRRQIRELLETIKKEKKRRKKRNK